MVSKHFITYRQFDSCRFILKHQIPSMKGGRVPGLSQLSGIFLHLPCSVLSATSGLHLKAAKGMDTILPKLLPFPLYESSIPYKNNQFCSRILFNRLICIEDVEHFL